MQTGAGPLRTGQTVAGVHSRTSGHSPAEAWHPRPELTGDSQLGISLTTLPRPSRSDLVLIASWLVIGLVAAYDTYLSVKFQDSLPFLEVNPICRWLIAADEGSVAMLLGFKFAGTIVALGVILLVYLYRRPLGVAVATVVAGLQAFVLLYLCFA